MNAFAHVSGWLIVVATIIGSTTLTYLVVRPRPRRAIPAHKRRKAARTWVRWIGPRMWLRFTSHKHVQRAKHRILAATTERQAAPDLTEEPPDDWSPKREWGDRPFRTNLDRPHPALWQPATPRDVHFPGWGSPLIAAIAVTRVPQPLRNGGWNPVVPDTTWNRADQKDLNARLDWDRMLRNARVS